MSPDDLQYHFHLRINRQGFLDKEWTVRAPDEREALRKIVFRRYPERSRDGNLTIADSIYEYKDYTVLDCVPLYSEIFDPTKIPHRKQPDTTLRDIQKDMDVQDNIRNIKDTLSTEEGLNGSSV